MASTQNNFPIKTFISAIVLIVLTILVVMAWPFVIVNANQKGLVINAGKLSDQVLDEGFHWKTPFVESVRMVTTNPIELAVPIEEGRDGAITKDNQTIAASITTFYRYDTSKLVEMYRNYGEDKLQSAVAISVKESFKDVIGSYDIFSIAQNQEKIRDDVRKNLVAKLAQYPLVLVDFKISNYDWSDAFNQQIEATMKKAQQVKEAEQDLLLTEQVAQKQVKSAEAEKQAVIIKAEGEKEAARLAAEAKALEGEGIRKYNEEIAQNLDVQIKLKQLDIEMKKAETWNGKNVSDQVFYPLPINLQK